MQNITRTNQTINTEIRRNRITNEQLREIISLFSENAKSYIQLSTAALILPIIFLRQVLGIAEGESLKGELDWSLVTSWLLFLAAIGSGLFYQYMAAKRIESGFIDEPKFLRPVRILYAIMLISFYLGACLFVWSAYSRL